MSCRLLCGMHFPVPNAVRYTCLLHTSPIFQYLHSHCNSDGGPSTFHAVHRCWPKYLMSLHIWLLLVYPKLLLLPLPLSPLSVLFLCRHRVNVNKCMMTWISNKPQHQLIPKNQSTCTETISIPDTQIKTTKAIVKLPLNDVQGSLPLPRFIPISSFSYHIAKNLLHSYLSSVNLPYPPFQSFLYLYSANPTFQTPR